MNIRRSILWTLIVTMQILASGPRSNTFAAAGPRTQGPQQTVAARSSRRAASTVAQSSSSSAALAGLKPPQVQAMLTHVFLAEARVNDLLSLVHPSQWKISGAGLALFRQQREAIRGQLKALEEWRYQFYYNPRGADLGANAASAMGGLIPGVMAVATTVEQYENPAAGQQFRQVAQQLASLRNSVASYVEYLQAQNQKELKGQPAGLPGGEQLQTERIATTPAAPPVSSLVIVNPPLTPAQVKAVLFKVYMSEFRVRDLLSQEHPDRWKASPADRALAIQARSALGSGLKNLEKWRGRFNQSPDNVYDAFQTYRSINALFHPLRVFSREAGKYENRNLAVSYRRRAGDLQDEFGGLIPYITFLLRNGSATLQMYESNLVNCQTQLGYAMHGLVPPPAPMRNIEPAFRGRFTGKKK